MSANQQFHNASSAEKRVMIARDVITQINIGQYIAASTYYTPDIWRKMRMSKGFGEMLPREIPESDPCICCGIGSCMLSMAKMEGFTKKDIVGRGTSAFLNDLRKYFSERQLALIEEFFENSWYPVNNGNSVGGFAMWDISQEEKNIINQSKQFFTHKQPSARLLQIMENIIRNEGIFDPEEEITFQQTPKEIVSRDLVDDIRMFKESEAPQTSEITKIHNEH